MYCLYLCCTNHFNWFLLVSFLLSCVLQFLLAKSSANVKWLSKLTENRCGARSLRTSESINTSRHTWEHRVLQSDSVMRTPRRDRSTTSRGLLKVSAVYDLSFYYVFWFGGVSFFVFVVPEIKITPLHAIRKGLYG